MTEKADVYTRVTNKILADLERGHLTWLQSYYATLAHECCHATRHPARLNRDLGRKRYGDAGYAMEELKSEPLSFAAISGFLRRSARTMPATSPRGPPS
jgi:antirestriction protein ArdC